LEDQSSNDSSTDDSVAPLISKVETANNNGSKQLIPPSSQHYFCQEEVARTPKMVVASKMKKSKKPPHVISQEQNVWEKDGITLLGRYFPGIIPDSLVATAYSTLIEMLKAVTPNRRRKRDKRITTALHFGWWRRFSQMIMLTSDTKHKDVIAWLKANKQLFEVH
jgi:hypothetical protein